MCVSLSRFAWMRKASNTTRKKQNDEIKVVVANVYLVVGLEHVLFFHILEIIYSQLTNQPVSYGFFTTSISGWITMTSQRESLEWCYLGNHENHPKLPDFFASYFNEWLNYQFMRFNQNCFSIIYIYSCLMIFKWHEYVSCLCLLITMGKTMP